MNGLNRSLLRAEVKPLNIPAGQRVLVISDVHAQINHLEGVLRQAEYNPAKDKLILLGDMMEKGPESLKFLHYLMDFPKGKDVELLRGNCDHLVLETAYDLWPKEVGWSYMSLRPESVLWQMAAAMDFTLRGPEDFPAFSEALRRNFLPELDFLRSWPVIGETPEAIFVHGGIPQDRDIRRFEAHKCMKNDNFLRSKPVLRRWCVVGHTPTTLYREDYPCADPVWDRKKKILSIDGGCGIKPDGQLNCVIFPSWGEERMEYTFYDGLRPVTALMPQEESAVSRNLHWGHHRVQLLEEGEEFARCRQLETGYEMDIPSGYLYTRGGVLFSQDITDYRPAVEPGDTLKVVMETSRGLLCKKGSVTGWYLGEYEPKDE